MNHVTLTRLAPALLPGGRRKLKAHARRFDHLARSAARGRSLPRFAWPILCLIAIASGSTPLRAHDLYTSWTEARLGPERLELTLTLARGAALRLLPGAHAAPPITPENFADYAPQLRRVAALLFTITAAGKALTLRDAVVTISGDNDITFQLTYPPAKGSPLRFKASYLLRQIDGHNGTIVVVDAQGKDLDWSPVTVEQPVFELPLR